jgi:hypothetical protein
MLLEEWLSIAATTTKLRAEDVVFAYEKYRSLFVGDDAVLATGAACAFLEPDGRRAAPPIVDRIHRALREATPLSLIRVGNGEGNAVAMLERPVAEVTFQGFDFEFVSQNGISIDVDEASALSIQVVDAIRSADIQGYRIGRFDEDALIRQCLSKAALSPVLGLIYARRLFHTQVREAQSTGTWFTNAWIHLDLIDHLDALLAGAASVVVITGRPALQPKLSERLGARLRRFIAVPVQGYAPRARADSHFASFEAIRAVLRNEDLAGTLVLVGAGLFGKVYCQDAKASGAVAIDLGSAFDLLAGVATRPVHRQIDLAAVRW